MNGHWKQMDRVLATSFLVKNKQQKNSKS